MALTYRLSNMLQIRKLYSTPELFAPVTFLPGVNLILGETSESSKKTNGVGKSIAIEFLNFALLNNYADSRVKKVPESVFPLKAYACVDLVINGNEVTIQRSREFEKRPTIIIEGKSLAFSKLDDARQYIENLLFRHEENERPSFRSMLSILMRDERSEFKSIVNGLNTSVHAPDDYTPHLYLLGIDVRIYKRIKNIQSELKRLQDKIREFKKSVVLLRNKKLEDARADLNELDAEVAVIQNDLESLENFNSNEELQQDVQRLDSRIAEKRREAAILLDSIARLKPVERERLDISHEELSEYYNDLKAGLGDLVSKDLDELYAFKQKVYNFQNDVLKRRRAALESDLEDIREELKSLDKEYEQKLRTLDQKGALRTLKQTIASFQEKSDELADLRSFIVGHDKALSDKREKTVEKDTQVLHLQSDIDQLEGNRASFEETILSIHNFVMGNRQASFTIKTVDAAQVVEILLRIDSDGSHSVDREKTFIYDFALLINDVTKQRHLGFLVHDNIFDVDTDTLKRSLKFILNQSTQLGAQYILTLNSDRVSSDAPDLLEALDKCVRARYTKSSRFLGCKYQEV
ncbi:MAG: hypothetical protein CMI63_19540 [Parvularcula sp.]|nr:hypothetical protein [Parvularcula sp.]